MGDRERQKIVMQPWLSGISYVIEMGKSKFIFFYLFSTFVLSIFLELHSRNLGYSSEFSKQILGIHKFNLYLNYIDRVCFDSTVYLTTYLSISIFFLGGGTS